MRNSNIDDEDSAAQDPGRLMTQKEVAKYLRISQAALERWRSYGGGPPYIKIGRMVRYRFSDVRDYVESLSGLVKYKGKVV